MKKRIISITLLLILVLTLSGAAIAQRQQQRLADKLVRLHVVARSDSHHDQAVKLQVRDAVLACTQPLLEQGGDARQILADHLPQIQAAAEQALLNAGEDPVVTVGLGKERFSTREYDSFSLPAGIYEALRVTIGTGEGRNWWCVVFPSLCLTASMAELEQAAQAAGLTEGEIRFITGDGPGFQLKFKTLELLEDLKAALFRKK